MTRWSDPSVTSRRYIGARNSHSVETSVRGYSLIRGPIAITDTFGGRQRAC